MILNGYSFIHFVMLFVLQLMQFEMQFLCIDIMLLSDEHFPIFMINKDFKNCFKVYPVLYACKCTHSFIDQSLWGNYEYIQFNESKFIYKLLGVTDYPLTLFSCGHTHLYPQPFYLRILTSNYLSLVLCIYTYLSICICVHGNLLEIETACHSMVFHYCTKSAL